ncbi:rhamnogalacturonan lyase [Sphingomonas sp. FW199]|uniref:rhamnogalacturonan lyase n=1 Tax=Sphingomonas sp. FW199 TaxID=3400217 RepID=UPI003CEC32F8
MSVMSSLLLASSALAAPQSAPAACPAHVALAPVAVPAADGKGVHISWRMAKAGQRYDLYRDGKRIVRGTATSHVDATGTPASRYAVALSGQRPCADGIGVWERGYWSLKLDRPAGRTTPRGEAYTYNANDASAADLDGDGVPEILLKWDPSISKDNAFAGYSGETIIDAYRLDGTRLWRIDLGRNIRSGAHYTQFMAADFDGDGRAELMMKTADGTIDGTGAVIGDANADWRGKDGQVPQGDRTGAVTLPDGTKVAPLEGRILKGPEYLSVFDGRTGRMLATAPYAPGRDPDTTDPTPDAMTKRWGDGYANRSDRYLAGIATLDGKLPSAIFARGYYTRTTLAAWDWRGGKLTMRWLFDSATPGNEKFGGQGNHQLATADIDGDGRDEIVYGSMAIDDDGRGIWSTGLGHGDAMHVSDLDPARPGLEKYGVHEDVRRNGGIGAAMVDAHTGEVLWTKPAQQDTGRGLAADIDPRYPGAENWASNSPELFDVKGNVIAPTKPRFANFAIWWDGDALRELLSGTTITKWDWTRNAETTLLKAEGAESNNGTKATPALSADLLGDWREELILRAADNSELRIYATPIPTRIVHAPLMQDRQYRNAIAWQNTAYNQPPHPSYRIEEGK